ncbi:MAG: 5-(carboxyamino)imidazole ribonucleotide mutase [Candidatus Omnitrophica bacterium]|nr:5-(carboxyamino)imidazole ribonucleotide mutase [Candidatus Omnitrophota bacterium]
MDQIKVVIMMGNKSDSPIMAEGVKILNDFGVRNEIKVLSARQSSREIVEYVKHAEAKDVKVIICSAGGAASLAGRVAARVHLPVISVPVKTIVSNCNSLLPMVKMPLGVSVASVAIGKSGAKNAALLAIRILALSDKVLAKKLSTFSKAQQEKVLKSRLS